MTHIKAEGIFEGEFRSRWPDWNLTTMIESDWIGMLMKYNKADVRPAITEYLQTGAIGKCPNMSRIITCLRKQVAIRLKREKKPDDNDPVLGYTIICTDLTGCRFKHGEGARPQYRFAFKNRREMESLGPDKIKNIAEYDRQKVENLYGGKWIVIIPQIEGQIKG